MIRKLRFRFIAVSMAALLAALALTMGLVGFMAHSRARTQYEAVLEAILDSRGPLAAAEADGPGRARLTQWPELPYEARFFTSVLTAGGRVEKADLSHIATVDRPMAERLTLKAAGTRGAKGMLREGPGVYSFSSRTEEEGTRFAFLDVTSRFWMFRELSVYCVLVGLVILVVFMCFISGYSKRVIAPYVVSMEKQQQFITNASHERKTPLAVISANTEMLEMLEGENKWTQSTLRQVQRMNGLVARLMTLARMEETRPEEMVTVDLSRLAAEEADAFENVVLMAGKTFEKDLEGGVLVRGDEKSLRDLCSILLDNAAKYCDEGGRVRIELKGGRHPALTVRNSYADASKVDTARFFERFYRADGSRNSKKQGYGIGLSIASDIARRMDTRIQVAAKDRDICFTVGMNRAEPQKTEGDRGGRPGDGKEAPEGQDAAARKKKDTASAVSRVPDRPEPAGDQRSALSGEDAS